MVARSFALLNLRVIAYAVLCLSCFLGVLGEQHDEDEHDDMAEMAVHDFADLDICEEPPPPMNGELMCSKHKKKKNKYVCKVECDPGFQFPNGKRKGRHLCDLSNGKWAPTFVFPDCIPICDPPCENGGECSDENRCICTPEYRGDRCQYDLALCDPNKGLHVSGDWSCNHTHTDTRCVLNCPQGTRYESQPAELYQCSLDGMWSPNTAPKCIPINIIESPAAPRFYSVSNGEAAQSKRPSGGVCATWSASHYRTFDGGVYSFTGSSCSYLFAKDCEQNTFAVHVQNPTSCASVVSCSTTISIYIGSETYVLANGERGPFIENEGNSHIVPSAINGLLFQMLSDYVTVSSPLGFKLKWNRKNTILLEVSSQLKNRTCGLCGKFDGSALNDFETSDGSITDSVEGFVNSWAMEHLGEKCEGNAAVKDTCSENKGRVQEAEQQCQVIFNERFSSCHQLVDPKAYYETCRMDYCGCEMEGSCHCSSLAEYFRECIRLGGKVEGGWRNDDLCPLTCLGGMIYKDCGTSCPQTCRGTVYDCEDDHCIDGCHCPEGTTLHNGQCIEKHACPCLHNEKEYQNGERIIQDCNACECNAGKWKCTEEKCEARCSSTGDPHYTTFDGLSYEFLGSCPYYLVFNENFTIVQETGPCSSQSNSEPATGSMFCTQSITIEYGEGSLLLQPGIKSTFNTKIVDLPFSGLGFSVSMATDSFLKASLENGLSVLWDGHNRIYIDAPPTLYDQTMGLCGTFNHNQNDDFLTPEKDVEADVAAFAARWQASDTCQKRSRRSFRSPCEMQPQKLADAEMLCYTLKSTLFSDCHGEVEPHPFYKGCVNDLCVCGEKLEDCLCPILADYSLSCARKGVILNWVDKIPACKPECTGGQIYKECGNPCTCTCEAVALQEYCNPQCVQGCVCPDGMTLNKEGFCIAIDQCPCLYEGNEYPSSDITVQGTEICKCSNAKWECKFASVEELESLKADVSAPVLGRVAEQCSEESNEEQTDCLETCPRTCQNFHLPPKCKTEECLPGCRCKEGFILDTDLQKCVDTKQCGCIHANKRYKEGDTIKQSCNLCTCKTGEWRCTEKVCPGICTAWGESHFKSYDGKIFDFHGDCEYIMSKGKMKDVSYTLVVQNVPCGSSGVTCSKSFTLDLGTIKTTRGETNEIVAAEEKLTLTKNDPLPKMSLNSRFIVLESGLFVLVYTDIGVTLRWDRGTRIYVTLDPKWRDRVNGLCGNFNDDQADDFLTPFGGIPEARASVFANSWKIHEFCPAPQTIEDTCAVHPERKSWAQQKCGILKSNIFESCRSAVAMEPFYERCVFDSCACDMGGDCDCLCTAIAAYAQECSIHGAPVKWRSQELCPIQCEECATYESCIPSCPKKTCENEYRYGRIESVCSSDFCVEGCNPKPCPAGQIYNNEIEYKCIPEVDCVIPCLEVNGVIYNEGDRVTDIEVADPCQSCHCHKGSIECIGNPCIKTEPLRPCLKSGWTPWMNTQPFVGGDYEELSNPVLKATYENFCGKTNMTGIECRVAETKIPLMETGQNVVCELPTGLLCIDTDQNGQICEDYEIRVFCDCGPMIETTTLPPATPLFTLAPVCDHTGWTPWMSAHLPNEEGESETLDRLRVNHYFCANHEIDDIECRSSTSWKYVTEEIPNVICNKKVGLVCSDPECDDFEVRIHCNCGPEVIETTPMVPSCVTGWTEFFNTDHPDYSDTGDDESLDRIRDKHHFCEGGTLEDIECKTVVNGDLVDYSSMDTFGLKCSKNVGFICNKYVRTDSCPDFMVRFYCACEPLPETTMQLIPTTTTALPVTHVPVECGWTPWLNIDTPDVGDSDDGDMEDLSKIQYLYKTCGGKDLVDIECRMSRTHHSYDQSLQTNLVCDTQRGFICHNEDQIGKCYDYEIRLLCMYDWCYPETTPIPTTMLVTTAYPCPDGQIYDECAYRCDQMCSSFVHEMIDKCVSAENGCIASCRPIDGCQLPYLWRDYYTCVPKEECTCILVEGDKETVVAPNEVVMRDCEKCQCVHNDLNCFTVPGCGTTQRPAETRFLEFRNITQADCWTEWLSIDIPSTGGGDLETLTKFRQKFEFCPDPVQIECRTVESKQKPFDVGQFVTCDLQTGLICWNSDNQPEDCYDYEIRFFCPCPTTPPPTTTTITPPPTLEPGSCVYGWTEWFNNHNPDNRGDYESIQSSRVNHVFCASDMVSAIECRRIGTSDTGSLQHGVLCDLQVGLICSQDYLGEHESCWDYEVRFFCDCPTPAPITEPVTLPPTTTKLPTLVSCSYWSDWINEHHPTKAKGATKKGVKGGGAIVRGDTEKALPLKLQREQNFCLDGTVTEIQCWEADTDVDFTESGDNKLSCTLIGGFRCRGKDQPGRMCKDYKIRYFCSCNEIPTTPIITKPTTPAIHIEPCTVYYNIIDGPNPIPDSRLKASSSRDAESGPQSARMSAISNKQSAGAWIAGEISDHQFIEVDLDSIQPIYGVVTKGRHGHQEWVKSYKVLYSRDGMAYAYVSEDGREKIFSGNFDGSTPVEHIFQNPFEARFVRLQPITFHKEIALRMDILGCAEGMTTVPVQATMAPPCIDEMGMYNGEITDDQIKTSSDRNPTSDGRFVRLNTAQTEAHAGGWVAADLDENQFVQIDFVEPRVLTGVKIQGRDMVPQWVTAFTVSYSQDGISWNEIMDSTLTSKRVFAGNYNSDTLAIVYFPQPIRARFIRIHPIGWENWIAMRLEILGCYEAPKEEVKAEFHTSTTPHMLEQCAEPMGFQSHELPDTLISVSSSIGLGSDASRIRLNTHSDEQGTGGWIAATDDYKPVVFIDFYGERNLTGIITQGLQDEDRWIKSYYVHYSLDNVTWEEAFDKDTGNFVFDGNNDRNTEVLRLFSHMILARYLKVILVDYHNGPALRMEILGCFIPYPKITPPPPVLITTTEFCVEYGPWLSVSDPASNHYGDEERISKIIAASGKCSNPYEIQCRSMVTQKDYTETGQGVTCDLDHGLLCLNQDQASFTCYNYEVRIKCWTCGIETTTTPLPLELCPEVPELMKENCPISCPMDHACDGYGCVPRIDCACFKDGKKFQPSNIVMTKSCQRCECILGGYSNCKPIECPACLPGQKSKMDEHCDCECVGCPEGTISCPTSGACISESQWCDGIKDCPDDEAGCPTTPPRTTTNIATTTTEAPIVCSTDYLGATDSCEMIANMFETFDGLAYQYDICDHVLLREKTSGLYSVSVHKSCSPDNVNSCQRYLIIEVDGVVLKIGPDVEDLTVQDNRVSVSNLWVVSKRFQDFELKKKGSAIVFRSKKYNFDVTWDGLQDARIVISRCSLNQVFGLCGFYNKYLDDDRTIPDGNLATSNEEFGNSWSIGPAGRCTPPKCAEIYIKKAISTCQMLRDEPFNSSCADYLKIESRVESCIVFMCECLQRTSLDARTSSDVFYDIYDTGTCKCLELESFVEACEAVKQEPLPEWRIQYDCTPECPPGMEWQDCGPGCELTCDNYRERDNLCNGGCTPGCYCPSGLIRHHNRCVKPKMCQDCVCRGHGDPNYITFDGKYYAFQGNCTYVLAQHLTSDDTSMNFRILATNVECPEEPHTSCTAGLQVFWNGHTIEKFKNKPVYLDDMALKAEDSPLNRDGISITYIPNKSTIIHIKSINLAIRYFDQMYGFNIELPAFFYFNKTEGLCGVCNFIQSDDLYHKDGYITEDIEDFAYSWLVGPETREHCEFPRVVVPEPPPGICNFTVSPCEVFLDPSLYSQSCQNDVTYSQKPEASMCRSKFQYAQQCCERGISLVEWLKLSGCDSSCPEGMFFECTSACQKTCDNYKTFEEEECDLMPLYTCRCPEGQVMKLGRCVEAISCETCDALGHIVGDVWNVGPCEQCECMGDLSTRCTVIECPEPPICKEKETLEKLQKAVNACCEAFQCVEIAEVACPEAKLQDCREGESNVITHREGCPVYQCECMVELCPPITEPIVDEGEFYSIEQEGCCPHYRTDCYPEKCSLPPICGPGFKLSTYESKCCIKYSCIPKKNVCVYRYKYDIVNGVQTELAPEESYEVEYEAGSSWQDGLCRKCSCIEIEGQHAFSCREEICPNSDEFPDAEKYVRENIHIPGACCPKYRRTACKADGIVYSIGEEWLSPDGNRCKSYKCVEDKGEAGILEKSTICDKTCPDFAIYLEPSPESTKCCGECKAVACEENGALYQDGETWTSVLKPCYKAECSVSVNGTHVVYRGQTCPVMPGNCPKENVMTDPKGCCTYCKKPTENCAAVQVPIYETRGYFGYVDTARGFCTNEDALEDLTKCSGQCTTESRYSNLIGDFESVCNCCLPRTSENRLIVLHCEDGSKVEKIYQQPLSCKCSSCFGIDRSLESMNKIQPL